VYISALLRNCGPKVAFTWLHRSAWQTLQDQHWPSVCGLKEFAGWNSSSHWCSTGKKVNT